jgi:uncharacterized protein (DUF433 family)
MILAPGVEMDPDVCGGEARIVRTRIPVWVLERARRLGSYPALRAEDLANAWAYARAHREEMDRDIAETRRRSRGPALRQ